MKFFTIRKPATPVNPAERPIAFAVLASALIQLHGLENFNTIYSLLVEAYPNLAEEIWEFLDNEQSERLSSTCKIIQLTA
jgi:uncharacterized spore protein YtfJ